MKQLPGSYSISALVEEFAARHPRFETPDGSTNVCKFVSFELAKFLVQCGVDAQLYHIEGCLQDFPHAVQTWLDKPRAEWSHYVVRVGAECVDLSGRQFDPDMAYPYICSLSDLRKRWSTVESDSFLNGLVDEFLPRT